MAAIFRQTCSDQIMNVYELNQALVQHLYDISSQLDNWEKRGRDSAPFGLSSLSRRHS